MPKYAKINCLLSIAAQPRGFFSLSVVNKAGEKTVKACWQLQIPCREVKLSDSYETNNSLLTSSNTTGSVSRSKSHLGWLSLLLVVNAQNAKLSLTALVLYGLLNHSRWSKITSAKSITNPSQWRPAKTIKRGQLLQKIIGCHSEKTLSVKIAKTSCGIKFAASEAFSYSVMYFSVSFFLSFHIFLSLSPLKFKI